MRRVIQWGGLACLTALVAYVQTDGDATWERVLAMSVGAYAWIFAGAALFVISKMEDD